jgi:hypothetical protein
MRSVVTVLPVLAFSLVARSALAVPAGADEPSPLAAPAAAPPPAPSSAPAEDGGPRPPGALSALGGSTAVAREASAPSDPRAPPPSNPSRAEPRTRWAPNQPLMLVGAGLALVGYGPNFVAGLPSAAGGVARGIVLVLTLTMQCFGEQRSDVNNYICFKGQHGAVQLLIPFVGPITFASSHPRDTVLNPDGAPLSGTTRALLYTSAALQIAGVSSVLLSLALGRSEPVQEKAAAGPSIYVAPLESSGVAGATVGLSLGVQRW